MSTLRETSQTVLENIKQVLGDIDREIDFSNAAGQFDINTRYQKFAIEVLNRVFELNLVDLDSLFDCNYPAIDLGDESSKVAFQVTSSASRTKIVTTFTKFENNRDKYSLGRFSKIKFLFLDNAANLDDLKKGTYDNVPNDVDFNPTQDLIDLKELYKIISNISDPLKLKDIRDIMKSELGYDTFNLDDFGILDELITYMLDHENSETELLVTPDNNALLHLTEKIDLNFDDDSVQTIKEQFHELWGIKDKIEEYLGILAEERSTKELALIEFVRKNYREIKNSSNNHVRVKDVQALDTLIDRSLPKTKIMNPQYRLYSIALILLIFERCQLGQLTPKELNNRTTIFDDNTN